LPSEPILFTFQLMTKWQPDVASLRRPVYLSLADQIARAIADGRLALGARLPTHRRLAEDLALSVQTVSRAYDELIRRGLISGETGRGTFVRVPRREHDPPYIPERAAAVIDLSILKPVCEPMHLERFREGLVEIAGALPPSVALSFRPTALFAHYRAVAVDWLKDCGLEAAADNVCLTNGATPGMTVALMAAAPRGTTVATEAVGHHTLTALAGYLGLGLRGLPIDAEGILPDALDEACREGGVRALFVMPSPIAPTASFMGPKRRQEIAAVAARHDIAIVENDPMGPLVEENWPPLAAFAPERTFYVTTFTKCVMPGLRAGYLVAPERYLTAVQNRQLVANWTATPLMQELASRWVENGTALELVRWQRTELRARHRVAAETLAGLSYRAQPESLHVWLPLGEGRDEHAFVAHARARGVAIAPSHSFTILPGSHGPAVRISVASTSGDELRAGLGVVVNLLRSAPEPALLAF
jgi:DNA-binding transcriptional MocR family regulator